MKVTFILVFLFISIWDVNAQENIGANRIDVAREMVRENKVLIEQYMDRLEIIEERNDQVEQLMSTTQNFDAAIASIEVLPLGDRAELDFLLNQIFSGFNNMIQLSNEYASTASSSSCREEIDRNATPAYHLGVQKLNDVQSLPPSTQNRDQLGLAVSYTLLLSIFRHYYIPMTLILCAR